MSNVLIIDSEVPVANALRDALSARGVQSFITADGTEGLDYAKSKNPQLIVLCVELARGSGYSVCNKLKKDPQLAAIPLVLTSSQATEETFEQHKKLRTRAEAYLKKPYDNGEIMRVVGQYVQFGSAAAEPPPAEELEVSVEDVEVEAAPQARKTDVQTDEEFLDVSFGEEEAAPATVLASAPQVSSGRARSATEELDALINTARPSPAPKTPSRAAPAPSAAPLPATVVAGAAVPATASAAAAEPRRATATSPVGDAEAERLRSENKQLRQRVARLEQDLQSKEVEFNDRLLQESSRSRDALEAKKKLATVERDIAKYQQQAQKAQADAEAALSQATSLKSQYEAAEGERAALSEKIGQLVDKVKELAAERDQVKQQLGGLQQATKAAQGDVETAEKVREKARKAVDIAMQLLEETRLLH